MQGAGGHREAARRTAIPMGRHALGGAFGFWKGLADIDEALLYYRGRDARLSTRFRRETLRE